MAPNDDLHLHDKTVNELLDMRKFMQAHGYVAIAQELTADLNARGYFDVPRACSCSKQAGDDPACPIHRGNHA